MRLYWYRLDVPGQLLTGRITVPNMYVWQPHAVLTIWKWSKIFCVHSGSGCCILGMNPRKLFFCVCLSSHPLLCLYLVVFFYHSRPNCDSTLPDELGMRYHSFKIPPRKRPTTQITHLLNSVKRWTDDPWSTAWWLGYTIPCTAYINPLEIPGDISYRPPAGRYGENGRRSRELPTWFSLCAWRTDWPWHRLGKSRGTVNLVKAGI